MHKRDERRDRERGTKREKELHQCGYDVNIYNFIDARGRKGYICRYMLSVCRVGWMSFVCLEILIRVRGCSVTLLKLVSNKLC